MSGGRQAAAGGITLLVLVASCLADSHDIEAQQKVESLVCGGSTVGRRLEEQTHAHSRRDLGWRFFPGDGYYDVERALRLSKSMEIRYRWRVESSGRVVAQTEPAARLCD